ncbi:hypothetical protein SAMN02745751_03103 [Dethiosulfatibacter aminovorans DSM 17477]|uniref:Uncharacterized protein n=1 Tax=Dethiosulfatibacter aminovorans DSM 17477 TaxID=1121476 RepID=A0A1M6L7D7_9FIRM|nr:hypothetical protein [Dethiosulfatibacter aminovorans]SHJ67123.1 hypothetical protein SAMN02745751_03103 [Dethiosulfatibacter aminovorans DSM 17477]
MKSITTMLIIAILLFTLSAYAETETDTERFDMGIDNIFKIDDTEKPFNKSLMERVEMKGYATSPLKLYTGIDTNEYL